MVTDAFRKDDDGVRLFHTGGKIFHLLRQLAGLKVKEVRGICFIPATRHPVPAQYLEFEMLIQPGQILTCS